MSQTPPVRAFEPLSVDESDELGARAADRLRTEKVIWLTTVSPSGAPTPNPVWFLWDGASSLRIFTMPTAVRLRHLAANPLVGLHFREDDGGGDIVILAGIAAVDQTGVHPDAVPEYLTKYSEDIPAIGETPESFAAAYSTLLTVTLTRLRGL